MIIAVCYLGFGLSFIEGLLKKPDCRSLRMPCRASGGSVHPAKTRGGNSRERFFRKPEHAPKSQQFRVEKLFIKPKLGRTSNERLSPEKPEKRYGSQEVVKQERMLTLQDDAPVVVPEGPVDPLPWSRKTTEVMIDATSLIKYFNRKARELPQNKDLNQMSDYFSWWPIRSYMIATLLSKEYGQDRPPSPWEPIIVVYDTPDPAKTWSGLQVEKYRYASREGPWKVQLPTPGPGTATLAFSQTYVDRSAAGIYRCDKEILYMLELLMRDFPSRRQVLVTASAGMKKHAERFCTVRGPKWLEAEILQRHGWRGKETYQALMGGPQGVLWHLRALPDQLRLTFTAS